MIRYALLTSVIFHLLPVKAFAHKDIFDSEAVLINSKNMTSSEEILLTSEKQDPIPEKSLQLHQDNVRASGFFVGEIWVPFLRDGEDVFGLR